MQYARCKEPEAMMQMQMHKGARLFEAVSFATEGELTMGLHTFGPGFLDGPGPLLIQLRGADEGSSQGSNPSSPRMSCLH